MKKYLFMLIALVAMCSCTPNQKARHWGGNLTVYLPFNEKLVNATWKESNLYYLTEPMDSDYVPKDKKFIEESNWGLLETTITFIERRK